MTFVSSLSAASVHPGSAKSIKPSVSFSMVSEHCGRGQHLPARGAIVEHEGSVGGAPVGQLSKVVQQISDGGQAIGGGGGGGGGVVQQPFVP